MSSGTLPSGRFIASLTAFLICFLLGPWLIRKLTGMQVGQYIRDDGPKPICKRPAPPPWAALLIIWPSWSPPCCGPT